MKTITTSKWAIVALLCFAFASCKKDPATTPEPEPDPIETETLTIAQLKALSTGTSVTITKENTIYKVKGVVVSDNSTNGKNIADNTAILVQEDNAAGIVVNFAAAHNFAAGTEVEIGVSNQKLEQMEGEIVLNAIPLDSARSTATGKVVTPRETDIQSILDNKNTWGGTLVKIAATELTGGNGNFEGTLNIKDETGELTSEIRAQAAFSGSPYPVSVSAITGILRISGNDTRIDIRKADDVVVGAYSRIEVENFENITGENPAGTQYYGSARQFETSFGLWRAGGWVMHYNGGRYDASFTTADRDYIYQYSSTNIDNVPHTATGNGVIAMNIPGKTGLKTVTIRFAGSTANEWFYPPSHTQVVAPFDAAGDKVLIAAYPAIVDQTGHPAVVGVGVNNNIVSSLLVYSEEHKEVGKWFEFTYTLPTKEELVAAGISESKADQFIEHPTFYIVNYSSRGGQVGDGRGPILFDKVTLYY